MSKQAVGSVICILLGVLIYMPVSVFVFGTSIADYCERIYFTMVGALIVAWNSRPISSTHREEPNG